jgi:hypothetical protein
MRQVSKKEYVEAVKEAEAGGAESVGVGTESGHLAAPKVAAMQTVKDGVVVAQATYWKGAKPKYEVR